MGKKCLVIGGDGFLGSHLVDDLLARGYEVRVFDHFRKGRVKNLKHLKGKVEFYKGDFLNKWHLSRALKGIEYVFHFVSLSTPASTADNPHEEIRLNLEGTLQLLDLCVKHGVKKVVYPSSGGAVYGDTLDEVASETTQLRPVSPYAVTKVTIEEYLHFYKRQHDLDFVIYRIANPYGERQSPEGIQGAIPIFIKHMIKREPLHIYGNTVRDYVYVKDATGFIAENFIENQKNTTYNIGSGRGVALFELVLMLSKTTQSMPRMYRRDRRPFDVQKVVLDISRANEEFGFYPITSLEVGLEKTYAYLKEKYDHEPVVRRPWFDMGLIKSIKWDRVF
jgi:UDP-glucose 4-epimerase